MKNEKGILYVKDTRWIDCVDKRIVGKGVGM